MPGQFEFDEAGDTFLCFLVAFYTLVIFPVTFFCWPSTDWKDFGEQKRKCMCQPCQVKRHCIKTSNPLKNLKKNAIKFAFALAWLLYIFMLYKLSLIENKVDAFDPFTILEIATDSPLKDIKKAYKRLSLKHHPDKGGDPKLFIQIAKAYAALTNEESRKNWEEHGNPDGPGAAHFGIALPKWMIQKENFYLVIGAYTVLFLLILPITIGSWWYNTMKFGSNNVLIGTTRFFCSTFVRAPQLALPRIIKILSNSHEFNPQVNSQVKCRPSDNVELPPDSPLKDIKKAYKRLSLKHHPDKGGDPKLFIQIAKAYAALTNEESRKNWEEHGNPDGPGAAHFGIALPKWMIQKENFYLVIGAYTVLFLLILPITIGSWWYNTMKFGSNNVLIGTTRFFCSTFVRAPQLALPRIIKILSNSHEFNPQVNSQVKCRPSDNVELPPLIRQIPIFTIFKKAIVGSPYSVKARALMHAHLDRIELPKNTLFVALPRFKPSIYLSSVENCMRLVPLLVQSLTEHSSPLLQLPHLGQSQLRHMSSKLRNVKSIRQLVRLPDEKRRTVLSSLSDEQYRDVVNVCASMPNLAISYRCEVLDDDDSSIWPLSWVTATVNVKRYALLDLNAAAITSSSFTNGPSNPNTIVKSNSSSSLLVKTNHLSVEDQVDNRTELYSAVAVSIDDSSGGGGTDPNGVRDQCLSMDDNGTDQGQAKKNTVPIWDRGKRGRKGAGGGRKGKQRKKPLSQVKQQSTSNYQQQPVASRGDIDSDTEILDMHEVVKASTNDSINLVNGIDDTSSSPGTDFTPVAEGYDEADEVENGHLQGDSLVVSSNNRTPVSSPHHSDAKGCDDPTPTSSGSRSSSSSSTEAKPTCTHLVHCPYFPVEKFEGWWIYLIDKKTRQLITKPLYFCSLQTEEEFLVQPMPDSVLQCLKEQEQAAAHDDWTSSSGEESEAEEVDYGGYSSDDDQSE